MKARYDDTKGQFYSYPVGIDYEVNWDMDGPEIEIELITNDHGHEVPHNVTIDEEIWGFLVELENDKYMYEQTGLKTGHLTEDKP